MEYDRPSITVEGWGAGRKIALFGGIFLLVSIVYYID